MLRVGLTGGLGSGKSTAARLFAELGVFILEADEVGRALMQPGEAVYVEIVQHFGPEITRTDGTLDRQALAALAFDHGRLQELNGIVHPPVVAAQEQWMQKVFAANPDAICMVESALIFEADHLGTAPGWRQRFDRIVLVTASHEQKIARYVARILKNGTQPEDDSPGKEALVQAATKRLASQIPDHEKARESDYIIDNSGTPSMMQLAVAKIYTHLKAQAQSRAIPAQG